MTDPLLKTKLSVPLVRNALVKRPRLDEELNAGLQSGQGFERKLTLVCAPAGYGKTTLVVDWLTHLGLPMLWLTLDEGDNDPARFLAYLISALQTMDKKIGLTALAMLQSPQPPSPEMLMTTLINDLAGISSPFLLVLDDYHLIHNPFIHRQVGFFLEHQPDTLHQVILTREDPLLPISRLRSRGQLGEIRQDDLRFTPAETADFLLRFMELVLSDEDIDTLHNRTEGWVVGLQLAALALRSSISTQGPSHSHQFMQSFAGSSRYILEYLFDEIFSHQDAATQDFLMCTSILEKLTPSLCDWITQRSDSRVRLEAMERANLFITPIDPEREWYRYHHLFAELLRHQLKTQDNLQEKVLHLRACQWFEEHDFLSEAMQHALSAGDWELAGRLISRLSDGMLKQGEFMTLLSWFKKFPEEVVRLSPSLSCVYSWSLLLSGQYEAAGALLEHAEAQVGEDQTLAGDIATAQAYLARSLGDMPRTIEYSERALALSKDLDQTQRSILLVNLGMAYWHTGQIPAAGQALNEARASAQASGNLYVLLTSIIFLGRVMGVQAELRQAERIFQQAIQNGGEAPILALAFLDLATTHYEYNDLESCRTYLQRGIAFSERSGNIEFKTASYMLLARLEFTLGNSQAVLEAIQKIEEMTRHEPLPLPTLSRFLAFQAEIALLQGNLDAAQSWIDQLKLDADAHPFYRFLNLVQARLLIAQGHRDQAASWLVGQLAKAESSGWVYGAIVVRILLASLTEDLATAGSYLAWALEKSQPAGFIRSYVDAGPSLVPLLHEAARQGIHPEYVGQILTALGETKIHAVDQVGLLEPLSEREIEVLRLVAAGLSNREIASQLYLSPGTVKTHVHNIYGKLGVDNRTLAVVRARELKLI